MGFWSTYAKVVVRHAPLVMIAALVAAGASVALLVSDPPPLLVSGSAFVAADGDGADGVHSLAEAELLTVYNPDVLSLDSEEAQQTVLARTINGLYPASGSNIWTEAALRDLRAYELNLREAEDFQDFCQRIPGAGATCAPFNSPVSLFFPHGNDTLAPIESTLDYIASVPPLADLFLSTDYDAATHSGSWTRSFLGFGSPLAGYVNSLDDPTGQYKEHEAWTKEFLAPRLDDDVESDLFEALAFGAGVSDPGLQGIVFGDLKWAAGAVVFVLGFTWFHTGSLPITLLGILHLIMSIPLSLVPYTRLYGVTYIFLLNQTSFFVLLGVGADDIFVLLDAWKQSSHIKDASMEQRMEFTLRRSVKAMLVTSLTTAAAFLGNFASPLIQLQNFGMFTALLVTANYLLVITWFPSAVILVDRLQRKWSATGVSSLDLAAPRLVERFLKNTYAPWLYRWRWAVIVTLLAGTVVGGFLATGLEPDPELSNVLPDDSDLWRAFEASQDQFAGTGFFLNSVHVTWGISGIDRSARDRGNIFSYGSPEFKDDFDPSSLDSQARILDTCASLRVHPSIRNGEVGCILEEVYAFRNNSGQTIPIPPAEFLEAIKNYTAFELEGGTGKSVNRVPPTFSGAPELDLSTSWEKRVGFDPASGELRYLKIVGNLEATGWLTQVVAEPIYDDLIEWLEDVNDDSPEGLGDARQIADRWMRFQTEQALQVVAFYGTSVSLLLAFVVLLIATRSFALAAAAIVCVTAILVNLIGVIVAIGWKLGVIESIALVVSVGLSVDYTVHFATAYMDSDAPTREGRMTSAAEDLGISVFSAGLTTIGAAAFLLPASFTLFVKFGTFLILVSILSLVLSFGGFLALASVVGPLPNQNEKQEEADRKPSLADSPV